MENETIKTDSSLDALNKTFLFKYPKDAARAIEAMPFNEGAQILNEQPIHIIQRVWSHITPSVSTSLLKKLTNNTAASLLSNMDLGHCAALLGRLEKNKQEHFLSLLQKSTANELRELLEYPENTAGKLMDTKITAFNKNITVADALKQLKHQKAKSFHYLFLLNDDMHLDGQVDMQMLALASGAEKLSSIATPPPAYVNALDPRDEVIEKLQKFKISTIPVIDGNDRLVGIIHESGLINALQESVATDLQTMVGVSKDERALSSAWFAVRKRQPWLQINLLTAFLAAAVVGIFEDTIAQYTALAILLPIAAGQSGNTGAQALAVTMRGLTLREITVRHWLRITLKEGGAAIVNGIAIAITCGAGVYLWSNSIGLSLIIALAMVSSMTLAAVAGALVPIVLKRMGQDPALSSSIILTTITDIAGFMSFLGIATMLSGMLDTPA